MDDNELRSRVRDAAGRLKEGLAAVSHADSELAGLCHIRESRYVEAVAIIRDLWEWQRGIKELLPTGMSDRIKPYLTEGR